MSVTRDDLVGQYVGHTAPKTKEVLKRAMGGVLFIDEAYYLYRAENERDYGGEAIEILLQYMENHRDDLVVIGDSTLMPIAEALATDFEAAFCRRVSMPRGTSPLLSSAFKAEAIAITTIKSSANFFMGNPQFQNICF